MGITLRSTWSGGSVTVDRLSKHQDEAVGPPDRERTCTHSSTKRAMRATKKVKTTTP